MVSIIVAAYNAEDTISECIESIFRLNWRDYELIVVDDGSTDSTRERCLRALEGRDNARYIRQENAGAGPARNAGMDAAQGEFIMFVDGDDLVEPNLIQKLMEQMGPETDIAACCCLSFLKDEEPRPFHFYGASFTARTVAQKEPLYAQLLNIRYGQPDGRTHTGIGVPWGKLYRVEALRGLRFPDLRRMQDNVFNMYAFAMAREIAYLDEPLYRYRRDHIAAHRLLPEAKAGVIRVRERFFSEHPEYRTPLLMREFYGERIRGFCEGVRFYAAQEGVGAGRKIRAFCDWDIYRELLREPLQPGIRRSNRVAVVLARLHLYGLLARIFAANERRRAAGG